MLAVKTEVLKRMLADAEWSEKLEKAKSWKDVQRVIVEYCRVNNQKIVHT